MKLLRLVLALVMACAFASSAAAATTVNLSTDGGVTFVAHTLSSFSIDPNTGTITLAVSGSTPPPSGCTNNAPSITVTGAPTTATVGTPVSATVSVSDRDGQVPTVTANVGTVTGSTWTYTPTVAGSVSVTLTASDGQNCNNTSSSYFTMNVSGQGGGPTNCTLMNMNQQYDSRVEIGSAMNYCFTLTSPVSQIVSVYMSGRDWSTNQDMFVSDVSQPTCDAPATWQNVPPASPPWYTLSADNNEYLYLYPVQYPAGRTFYVTICNRSVQPGSYRLYWYAY